MSDPNKEGILLIDKPKGKTSFSLVAILRKLTKIRKIGHAGTLDPFATGLMVMLIGQSYTRLQANFMNDDKEYRVKIRLGSATESYDTESQITMTSDIIPTSEEVETALLEFQGEIEQIPPMYSAKKVDGKKLYELARKGIEIERKPKKVTVATTLISYEYPYLQLEVKCSKGTYIRSIAHDLGIKLKSYGHAEELVRTKSGPFSLSEALTFEQLTGENFYYPGFFYQCKSSPLLTTSPILVHR